MFAFFVNSFQTLLSRVTYPLGHFPPHWNIALHTHHLGEVYFGSYFRNFGPCSAVLNTETAWWKGLCRGKWLISWRSGSGESREDPGREIPSPLRASSNWPHLLTAHLAQHPVVQSQAPPATALGSWWTSRCKLSQLTLLPVLGSSGT